VKSFKVKISQKTLNDLHKRFANTRWTDEVSGADLGLRHKPGLPEEIGKLLEEQI
jgi:hypothetical protein